MWREEEGKFEDDPQVFILDVGRSKEDGLGSVESSIKFYT